MSPTETFPIDANPLTLTTNEGAKKTIQQSIKEKLTTEITEGLLQYEIVDEAKAERIADYAFTLVAKQPQMSGARIIRKTAEYFKLKKNPIEESVD